MHRGLSPRPPPQGRPRRRSGRRLAALVFLSWLTWLAWLACPVGPLAAWPVYPAYGEKQQVSTLSLPAKQGVITEAQTIIDAPAAVVAQVVGDPASFVELFPAVEARVVGTRGAAQLVAVARKEPWPVGIVRWVESVERRQEDKTLVVERQAQAGAFFRFMKAIWRVTPLAGQPGRCTVNYHVSMDLARWAPTWMLRRGNIAGMVTTLEHLRHMSERR